MLPQPAGVMATARLTRPSPFRSRIAEPFTLLATQNEGSVKGTRRSTTGRARETDHRTPCQSGLGPKGLELGGATLGDGRSWFAPVPSLLKKATRRSPNEHLGFGDGIHFCLDTASARIQARVAITMLLERFARFGFCRSRMASGFQGQHDGARPDRNARSHRLIVGDAGVAALLRFHAVQADRKLSSTNSGGGGGNPVRKPSDSNAGGA